MAVLSVGVSVRVDRLMRVCTPLAAAFEERLEVDVFVAVPGVALADAVFDHDVHKFVFGRGFCGVAQLFCHVVELAAVGCTGMSSAPALRTGDGQPRRLREPVRFNHQQKRNSCLTTR